MEQHLITVDHLKTQLGRKLGKPEKLLLILASFGGAPASVKEMRTRGAEAGLLIPKNWKIPVILNGSGGKAICIGNCWEITGSGNRHLAEIGLLSKHSGPEKIASDLRKHCRNIADSQTRKFVEEAIACYESHLYRSAITMSWLAAVHVLQVDVNKRHLKKFNAEGTRRNGNWRPVRTIHDLAGIRDADFLDHLAVISVIGPGVKKALKGCLDLRNSAAHPNSLNLSTNMVAAHIECLLLNVFQKF